jgi:hypothetical protein
LNVAPTLGICGFAFIVRRFAGRRVQRGGDDKSHMQRRQYVLVTHLNDALANRR